MSQDHESTCSYERKHKVCKDATNASCKSDDWEFLSPWPWSPKTPSVSKEKEKEFKWPVSSWPIIHKFKSGHGTIVVHEYPTYVIICDDVIPCNEPKAKPSPTTCPKVHECIRLSLGPNGSLDNTLDLENQEIIICDSTCVCGGDGNTESQVPPPISVSD